MSFQISLTGSNSFSVFAELNGLAILQVIASGFLRLDGLIFSAFRISESLVELDDVLVKRVELGVHLLVDACGPALLDVLELLQGLFLLLHLNILLSLLEVLFNVGVGSGDDVDKEVVHDICIVSLEDETIWSSAEDKEHSTSMQSQSADHD